MHFVAFNIKKRLHLMLNIFSRWGLERRPGVLGVMRVGRPGVDFDADADADADQVLMMI